MAVDADGNLYVADASRNVIHEFTGNGTLLVKWGTAGTGPGEFDSPLGVAVSADGSIYIADTLNDRIQMFRPSTPTPVRQTTWGRIKQLYR
jgi:DNA-binding beta-propeller fold protein YncE